MKLNLLYFGKLSILKEIMKPHNIQSHSKSKFNILICFFPAWEAHIIPSQWNKKKTYFREFENLLQCVRKGCNDEIEVHFSSYWND